MHHGSTLETPDGVQLQIYTWSPTEPPVGVVLIVHGLAEHAGRYAHLAASFNQQGYAVVGFDLRGHGASPGKRIYINHFDEYVVDLQTVFDWVKERFADKPFFLLGHSMGTTVCLSFLVDKADHVKGKIQGVIQSATALLPGDDISPVLISLAGVLSALFPKMPTVLLNSSTISKDPAVVAAYHADPAVYNGKIPARTAGELNRVCKYLQAHLHKIDMPLLVMHGDADELTNPKSSELLFEKAGASDKTLKLWPGLYHEIFNEPEQVEVISFMQTWLGLRSD